MSCAGIIDKIEGNCNRFLAIGGKALSSQTVARNCAAGQAASTTEHTKNEALERDESVAKTRRSP
jgi:hypothetical protein